MSYPIIETCGIEYETDNILPGQFEMSNWNSTRDASIETPISINSAGLVVERGNNNLVFSRNGNRSSTMGTEIVSIPLNSERIDILKELKSLTKELQKLGEPDTSVRAGIHIHIGFTSNLRILKSVVRLGRHLEDLFFALAGNGYKYRGSIQDGVYCRPITKYGPTCVKKYDGDLVQIFNVNSLLKAENTDDFWNRYGNNNHERSENGNLNRHHPVRYHWLNIFSLLAHGTLEFRIFNKTLNPYFIYAEAVLCKTFCSFALNQSYATLKELDLLTEHSVYDNRSKEEIAETLIHFAEISGLDNEIRNILLTILDKTPECRIKPGYIMSHLYYTANMSCPNDLWYHSEWQPELINESARKPEFTEVHNLNRGE